MKRFAQDDLGTLVPINAPVLTAIKQLNDKVQASIKSANTVSNNLNEVASYIDEANGLLYDMQEEMQLGDVSMAQSELKNRYEEDVNTSMELALEAAFEMKQSVDNLISILQGERQ